MKIKLHHIFLSFLLTTPAFINTSFAQDAATNQDYQITETEREKYERDKVIFSPGEGDTRLTPKGSQVMPGPGKDSVVVAKPNPQIQKAKPEQAVKAAEKQQQQTKDDDSILSFNFLYYIIQKYKLQDIVD